MKKQKFSLAMLTAAMATPAVMPATPNFFMPVLGAEYEAAKYTTEDGGVLSISGAEKKDDGLHLLESVSYTGKEVVPNIGTVTWKANDSDRETTLTSKDYTLICSGKAAAPAQPTTPTVVKKPTYRFFNPLTGEHFYTSSEAKRDGLIKDSRWNNEGQGWVSPETSRIVVYRLCNPNTGEHHYTTDKNEYDTLPSYGWRQEGTGFYSADPQLSDTAVVYRLFNPKANDAGSHHYTMSEQERNNLVTMDGEMKVLLGMAFEKIFQLTLMFQASQILLLQILPLSKTWI